MNMVLCIAAGGAIGSVLRHFAGVGAGAALAAGLVVTFLAVQAPVAITGSPGATSTLASAPWSEAAVAEAQAEGRPVLVTFTADWCVTCKANEKAVLNTPAFRELLATHDAVMLTGDWTNVDPAITAFLEAHGAVGVPLYVVYGPGAPPTVLPPVLTQAIVEDALLRASGH